MSRWRLSAIALLCLTFAALLYPQWPFLQRAFSVLASQVRPPPGQTLDWADALVYLPSNMAPGQTYPLVVVFSPDANARDVLNFWAALAERHRLVIYSSKIYRNHVQMDMRQMKAYIDHALAELPVDRRQVILTGLSGGGSFAHVVNTHYPSLAFGMIINTGQFWPEDHALAEQNVARLGPMRARVVMLASPTDFRFREMQRDHALLQRWGAAVHWIEFPGGHVQAPEAVYDGALAWLLPNGGGAR